MQLLNLSDMFRPSFSALIDCSHALIAVSDNSVWPFVRNSLNILSNVVLERVYGLVIVVVHPAF